MKNAIIAKIAKNFIEDKLSTLLGFVLIVLSIVLLSYGKIVDEIFYTILSIGIALLGFNKNDFLKKKNK